ncbi:MAG: hypothetical protein HY721_34820 [Planctomycetes bacterium]|nr:hypothetical protein [Planctomycetota bacterium]
MSRDPLALAVSRGFWQALDTQAYDRAYDEIADDPDVQRAVDDLLDALLAAFRRRKGGRRARASAGFR